MKKSAKILVSCLLVFVMAFSFVGCGNTKMTEKNITNTVEIVESALKEFDAKTLEKNVDSPTLKVIMSYAKKHQQFAELGRAIFHNLSIKIDKIDVENQTVTVTVTNLDLRVPASIFANKLKSNYSVIELVGKLNNEEFLDTSLKELTDEINICEATTEATVNLTVSKGKKGLVLGFGDEAENAVSGGALTAIKDIYS